MVILTPFLTPFLDPLFGQKHRLLPLKGVQKRGPKRGPKSGPKRGQKWSFLTLFDDLSGPLFDQFLWRYGANPQKEGVQKGVQKVAKMVKMTHF